MQHNMKVQTKYYRLLASGAKTVELRLYDDKRRRIRIGDTIRFQDLSDENDTFTATVTDLYFAPNFQELCTRISPRQAGFETAEELVRTMVEFYPLTTQAETGVVGIAVQKETP